MPHRSELHLRVPDRRRGTGRAALESWPAIVVTTGHSLDRVGATGIVEAVEKLRAPGGALIDLFASAHRWRLKADRDALSRGSPVSATMSGAVPLSAHATISFSFATVGRLKTLQRWGVTHGVPSRRPHTTSRWAA